MILPICQFGEESLRSLSIEVDKKEIRSKSFKKLIRDMLETMYKLEGVGLAAPQVGVNKRLIVLDTNWFDGEPKPLILINPEIKRTFSDSISHSFLQFQVQNSFEPTLY